MSLAREFFDYWCRVTSKRKSVIKEKWHDLRGYTHLIIHSDNSIIVDIATHLNLHCYNRDYYYLDAVFYHEDDYIKDFPDCCYLKDIRIAFEHENNFKSGLYQEVSHLLLINSDLKVLVSYPPDVSSENAELESLRKIISSSRNSNTLAEREGFLIIMGYDTDPYLWKGWLYNESRWVPIFCCSSGKLFSNNL